MRARPTLWAAGAVFERAAAFFDAHPDLVRVKNSDVLVIYAGKGLSETQPELVQGLSR